MDLQLDIELFPLPNTKTVITEDLLNAQYVGDSGFIIDTFSNPRNAFELYHEERDSQDNADITQIGEQGAVTEFPIDDPMDTSVSEDEIYLQRQCESDFPSEEE